MPWLEGASVSPATFWSRLLLEDGALLASFVAVLFWIPRECTRVRGVAMLAAALVFASDAIVMRGLSHRPSLNHVVYYALHPSGVLWFLGVRGTVAVLAGLVFVCVLGRWLERIRIIPVPTRPGAKVACTVVLVAVCAVPWLELHRRVPSRPVDYATMNLLRVNAARPARRGFDPGAAAALRARHPAAARAFDALIAAPVPSAQPPAPKPRHVVVVLSESLSRVDSRRSGGFYDRLPRIDAVLARGATFRDVVSDGEITSDALVSAFTGLTPVPTPVEANDVTARFPFRWQGDASPPSVPRRARAAGYHTVFLSNAPLEFQGDSTWLERVGFDEIRGASDPIFDGTPRFAFDGPEDAVLFDRALAKLREAREPTFLVLLTVSLHTPYDLPDPRDRVEGSALLSQLAYVDRTTHEFASALEAAGLGDVLFVLMGDHRRMAPPDAEEERTLGVDASGRVVAGMVGAGVPAASVSDAPLTQSDVMAMVADRVEGRALRAAEAYGKGARLGLGFPFSVAVLDNEMGQIIVRRDGVPPSVCRIAREADPDGCGRDERDHEVAALLYLEAAWIESAQRLAL